MSVDSWDESPWMFFVCRMRSRHSQLSDATTFALFEALAQHADFLLRL